MISVLLRSNALGADLASSESTVSNVNCLSPSTSLDTALRMACSYISDSPSMNNDKLTSISLEQWDAASLDRARKRVANLACRGVPSCATLIALSIVRLTIVSSWFVAPLAALTCHLGQSLGTLCILLPNLGNQFPRVCHSSCPRRPLLILARGSCTLVVLLSP